MNVEEVQVFVDKVKIGDIVYGLFKEDLVWYMAVFDKGYKDGCYYLSGVECAEGKIKDGYLDRIVIAYFTKDYPHKWGFSLSEFTWLKILGRKKDE